MIVFLSGFWALQEIISIRSTQKQSQDLTYWRILTWRGYLRGLKAYGCQVSAVTSSYFADGLK